MEVESVSVGRRGRVRGGEWGRRKRGTKRVDPAWLKTLRLRLQQRHGTEDPTIPNTHTNSEVL